LQWIFLSHALLITSVVSCSSLGFSSLNQWHYRNIVSHHIVTLCWFELPPCSSTTP
jgi:hypothetical protein